MFIFELNFFLKNVEIFLDKELNAGFMDTK